MHTIHSELNVALSSEGVISNGDLHFICPFVCQLQVVKQERPILKHQDTVAVLRPKVPYDVCSYGLHNGDGFLFVPLYLPLDHRLIGASAGVAD